MMKLMSLDQATRITAMSVFVDGKYQRSEKINLGKIKDTDERVKEMGKQICAKILEEMPSVIFIEDVQNQNNAQTMKLLARLQGEIMGFAYAQGIPIYILPPVVWRKSLSFRQGPKVTREELKQQSINYVKEHFGIEVDDDTSDSICIGVAGWKINYEH